MSPDLAIALARFAESASLVVVYAPALVYAGVVLAAGLGLLLARR